MTTRKISWQELDVIRRQQNISVERVCQELDLLLEDYGDFMTGLRPPQEKHLADYMTFLKYESDNLGVAHLIRMRHLIKNKGYDEAKFWNGLGKSITIVRNQISRKRSISMDQIVRAYGVLGFEVVIRDVSGTKEVRVPCIEFENFKKIEKIREGRL